MAEASPLAGGPRGATELLNQLGRGNQSAAEQLLPLIYEELRVLARNQLRGEHDRGVLQTTALVHDAYMRLIDQREARWQNRAHFYALAARSIRRILLDEARGRLAAKRGGHWKRITLADVDLGGRAPNVDLLALEEALQKLAELDERQVRVVELRFFGGLGVEDTARTLDVSPRTVEADWQMARAWLRRELA